MGGFARRALAPAATAALVFAALAACGADEPQPPRGCTEPADIARALQAAPRAVSLPGGSRISACVHRARSDGDLQRVGSVLTQVADALAARATAEGAALQLGYLIGAARRGARDTAGIHVELVRRLEQAAPPSSARAPARRAYRAGLAAGRRTG